MNRKRISEISTRELLIIGIPTLFIGLVVSDQRNQRTLCKKEVDRS